MQTRDFPVIVIVGPTASGKTDVALELAERLQAVIVSADSRQFYRWMDIGTAKPTPEQLRRAKHYFVDFLYPREEYSAGQFAREARKLIREMREAGRPVVVVGGSGMYIQALLEGFFAPVVRDPKIKAALKRRAEQEGAASLHAELQRVDPQRAAELHPNDAHRIVRALEVYYVSGKPFSELQRQPRVPADFPYVQFGLMWPREVLYRRIEERVDRMMEQGLEREVRGLLAMGVSPQVNALQTVGYREMIQYIRGEQDRDAAVALIKQHTRNFAKRQITWFKRDRDIHWLEITMPFQPQTVADRILRHVATLT